MNAMKTYRALVNCRAGGFYRKAGEEFVMEVPEAVPKYLLEIGETLPTSTRHPAKGGKPVGVSKESQVTKKDIGATPPTPSNKLTSIDIIT